MNTKPIKKMFTRTMYIMVILALALSVSTVTYAASNSPFIGRWEATDVDGSDMGLSIGGPATGPFQITWTDDYISYCGGEAGIIRGTGWLNEGDPNLLEADVHLECFTTGGTLDFHVTLRFHPATNTLSIRYWFGQVTIWHRPGGGQMEEPAFLGLRVNYGHDWVESFYEGGHTVWVTVTDGDGNLKATAELVTEPKDFWGGETGFQTQWSDWLDSDGNPMENPPDIQPYDWVYGWVDNGASAQVQIGDIIGTVHLADDFIEGTIHVPWFSDELEVDCHSWGAPLPEEILKYDTVLPDGEDTYSCSWAGEWDIQPYQDVGVGYAGPDGHWVANAFFALNPRIVASEAGDWFWMTEFNVGTLDLFLYESADEGAALLWSGTAEVTDTWGITFVGYDILQGQDMMPGNYLVVSDGVNSKGLVLQPISVTMFDTQYEFMAGFAPAGSEVWAAAGPQDWQEHIMANADPVTGEWRADFAPFDILEEYQPWSYAHIYDEDGDANEGNVPPLELWVAAFTYDLPAGTFTEDGTYPYHFELEWSFPEPGAFSGQEGDLVISGAAEVYGGYVLLRGLEELRGMDTPDGLVCEGVGEINPNQPMRFLIGWLPADYGMTYQEAQTIFENLTGRVVWGDGMSAELARHEIIPFSFDDLDAWFNYVCSFTEAPPKMDLRVNYGHDWVESFYEGGHTVWVTVTDADGNVKATSELMTEPKDYWGGETGFQSIDGVWFDGDGSQMEYPPDLQPYDWVYAQVDNGATAQVQLGDILGIVDKNSDSVTGTIVAPWIADPVQVECLDWGSGGEHPINKDGGSVLTNGAESYSCNWNPETEWDVEPWQDIGVGYFTPNGHWVANAFRDERWMAFWTYDPSVGLFEVGNHSYYYEWAYTAPVSDNGTSGPQTMTIAGDPTPIYDGLALIGPWGLDYPGNFRPQLAWTGSACEAVSVLHPDQPMRLVWGWVNDYSMTYDEALAHFSSLTIEVFWDFFSDGSTDGSVPLATMSELIPFTGRDARFEYLCTLTEHP